MSSILSHDKKALLREVFYDAIVDNIAQLDVFNSSPEYRCLIKNWRINILYDLNGFDYQQLGG